MKNMIYQEAHTYFYYSTDHSSSASLNQLKLSNNFILNQQLKLNFYLNFLSFQNLENAEHAQHVYTLHDPTSAPPNK